MKTPIQISIRWKRGLTKHHAILMAMKYFGSPMTDEAFEEDIPTGDEAGYTTGLLMVRQSWVKRLEKKGYIKEAFAGVMVVAEMP